MPICSNCGQDYGEYSDFTFCLDCGTYLTAEPETPTLVKASTGTLSSPSLDSSNETVLRDGRILVSTAPEYLDELQWSDELTVLQTERILKWHAGKWIIVQGTLREAKPFMGKILAYINRGKSFVGITFRDKRQIDLISGFAKNSPIQVLAKIELTEIGDIGVVFNEGEIL